MTAAAQWNDRVRRRLKLRDVDILLAVIQTGSMGKAASALNMSQPAVSKAIAYLESTLGVRLLDRSRQGVEPTPYGRALIAGAGRHVRRIAAGRSGHRVSYRSDGGEIRMGGSEHTISAIYSPVIHRFSAQYPRMSFTSSSGPANDVPGIGRTTHRFCGEPNVQPSSEEHSVEVLLKIHWSSSRDRRIR
jgi:DNA-binding transcriptional LysR family regulator